MGCLRRSRSVRDMPHGGEVLLLGCQGCGKTLLCRHLHLMAAGGVPAQLSATTQPTIGVELLEVAHRATAFTVREVGGAMQTVWPRYFDACAGVVVVVDASTAEAAAAGAAAFYDLLCAEALSAKPVLLLFNKCDAAGAIPDASLRLLTRLDELQASHGRERSVAAQSASALSGDGLAAVLDWAVANLPVGCTHTVGHSRK